MHRPTAPPSIPRRRGAGWPAVASLFTAAMLPRAALPGGVAVIVMSKAPEPPQLSFADQVDRIVNDELNLTSPPDRPFNLPAGVDELASALVLLHELLGIHQKLLLQHRGSPRNDGLIPAKRMLQNLRDGRRGPIWTYIDSVRDTRRAKNKTQDDVLNETFQAALVGLVLALETKFGESRRKNQELVKDECKKHGLDQTTRAQLQGWHRKFANMADNNPESGQTSKPLPQTFAKDFCGNYSTRDGMLSWGVKRALDYIQGRTNVGLTGL